MNKLTKIIAAGLIAAYAAAPLSALAADKVDKKKPKPYPLETCIVSDEKLGEMGEPFAFTHQGQEYKLCCKPCQKDFKKDPAKFVKKLEQAEKKKTKK